MTVSPSTRRHLSTNELIRHTPQNLKEEVEEDTRIGLRQRHPNMRAIVLTYAKEEVLALRPKRAKGGKTKQEEIEVVGLGSVRILTVLDKSKRQRFHYHHKQVTHLRSPRRSGSHHAMSKGGCRQDGLN